ncbi:MerR family transcriptional regulator [Salinimicrobium gaetbulicola]|uniref:MerR family transcriptional regulator n=1 Tax=Salinimicrobium gaetbulicola TaxID=999702 RepID=A0ABW3IBV8_9FLAO
MNSFSISQLSQFSGVKPHTIRIWEQRYNALQPQRSEGNTRFYDSSQLRRLLNIVSLTKTGMKVSKLCKMSDEELYGLQKEYINEALEESDFEYFVSQMISAGMNYDENNFEKIFSHCFIRFGLFKTYREIIYPMVNRVGLLWTTNTIPPSQEHYITNLLRQKLFTSIDSLTTEADNQGAWMLFLPEDEFHEMGLLFANYLIRSMGKKVIYLGPNVPLSSVERALEDTGAENLLLFMVHKDLPEHIEQFIAELGKIGRDKKIFVAANKELAADFSKEKAINWLYSIEDLEKQFNNEKIEIS